jgi:hypothetical protein
MLTKYLKKGCSISGLASLLDGGGVVGGDEGQKAAGIAGSYSVAGKAITFFRDRSGDHPVNILPYVAGAISYTQMQGTETISGEFSGCTMAIYNDGGTTRVAHVDTARNSENRAPSQERWASLKDSGIEVADEVSTTGMFDAFLGSKNAASTPNLHTLKILAVATPVLGITTGMVTKSNGVYSVVA